MKYTGIAVALTAFAILTGCETPTPGMLSLHPIATDKDTEVDASLVGTWEAAGDGEVVAIIRSKDARKFEIVVLGGEDTLSYNAALVRIGDVSLLDVTPADKSDFRVPGHAIARIWPTGTGLRWAFLDSDWLKNQAAVLGPQSPEGKMLLLSPTSVVRSWLALVAGDGRAYGDTVTWRRMQ